MRSTQAVSAPLRAALSRVECSAGKLRETHANGEVEAAAENLELAAALMKRALAALKPNGKALSAKGGNGSPVTPARAEFEANVCQTIAEAFVASAGQHGIKGAALAPKFGYQDASSIGNAIGSLIRSGVIHSTGTGNGSIGYLPSQLLLERLFPQSGLLVAPVLERRTPEGCAELVRREISSAFLRSGKRRGVLAIELQEILEVGSPSAVAARIAPLLKDGSIITTHQGRGNLGYLPSNKTLRRLHPRVDFDMDKFVEGFSRESLHQRIESFVAQHFAKNGASQGVSQARLMHKFPRDQRDSVPTAVEELLASDRIISTAGLLLIKGYLPSQAVLDREYPQHQINIAVLVKRHTTEFVKERICALVMEAWVRSRSKSGLLGREIAQLLGYRAGGSISALLAELCKRGDLSSADQAEGSRGYTPGRLVLRRLDDASHRREILAEDLEKLKKLTPSL